MVFENLADKLQGAFKNLTGRGKLTEKDVKDAMREVKLALLEADVNFKIVKDFVKKVTDRAIGIEVLGSLTPGQQVIKIVNEELTELMGKENVKLTYSSQSPTTYMLVGLQGAGKTTTAGKLAAVLRKQGKKPLLVACDIYRPAAIKQLQVVGKQLDIPVFALGDQVSPIEIAKQGIAHAKKYFNDVVILDTAGRLHIDEELMGELKSIQSEVKPQEILLVVDSMTGQDAVNVADHFNASLEIDGVILTKLDGDTRGGAALSVRAVTGKPIKYACVGEKLSEIEEFHPDRMASRILGMGDVLSLIEKAQEAIDEDKAIAMAEKLKKAEFDLEDFLDQLQQMKKMGPLGDILKMIPGMNKNMMKDVNVDEKQLVRTEAIIQSMTRKERQKPGILNASRRKRIAAGSGTTVADVNRLIKQFEDMKKMMKQFGKMNKGGKRAGGFKMPF
ncbi:MULTISPECIES: signal recognition particle protein [unclassified Fusibacter]|uniref:signal recognition particle protein n=1 Tax=unclassified Fusibacter TaxID=2624464 RepID=UPI0010103669|nr:MULTISPECIES: signal recognition particle protein [unclassified Fusibacter]MCK8058090.1 signal recognition particle protein [Fusibacter sp. A2]NPE20672.1 signal recognition particle protein [Fusibacter sp. A1]RXV62878.1 signal recognition particle protein [Fusibacter sp. A1]